MNVMKYINITNYTRYTKKARLIEVSEYQKPTISEIILLSGEIIETATIEIDAPALPGFIALVEKKDKSVRYVALSAISSFSIDRSDLMMMSPEHYLTPTPTIKVKE